MATHLLTPSPSPAPTVPMPALSEQINTATRSQHARLNRLIMNRLPLALPPNASNPELYGRGLAAFAQMYYVFEAAWKDLILSTLDDKDIDSHDIQLLQFLVNLRPHGLARTARLTNDVKFVSNRTSVDVGSTLGAQQHEILEGITHSIAAKPHLLIAYGWVLYMALFSGGRWIRQQLAAAGLEFWTGEQDITQFEKHGINLLNMPGISFLSFDSEQDGEDIKALFKVRFAEADSLLTLQERQEVVDAAQDLFDDCITLVGMLDRSVGQQERRKKMPLVLVCIAGILIVVLFAWLEFGYKQ